MLQITPSVYTSRPIPSYLPLENNQIRVQRNGQQRMTPTYKRQRANSHKRVDLPPYWYRLGKDNHHCRAEEAEDKGPLEAFGDAWDFFEEGAIFDFFGCGWVLAC
jgi:hypothetical protein